MTSQYIRGQVSPKKKLLDAHVQNTNTRSPWPESLEHRSSSAETIEVAEAHLPSLGQSAFSRFPNELLEHILDYLVHDKPKLLPIEERASLSSESFASVPPYIIADSKDLQSFSSTCAKFCTVGRKRLFARITIRATMERFSQIEKLVQKPELMQDVKKISYMVYDLYPKAQDKFWVRLYEDVQMNADKCQRRLKEAKYSPEVTSGSLRRLKAEIERSEKEIIAVRRAKDRANDQQEIIEGQVDESILFAVLAKCKNLEQIRLMRISDKIDVEWQNFLSMHRQSPTLRLVAPRWIGGCQRAIIVLGRAYLTSKCEAKRFSCRFMDTSPGWLVSAFENFGKVFEPSQNTHLIEAAIGTIKPTKVTQSRTAFTNISPLAVSNFLGRLTTFELQVAEPTHDNDRPNPGTDALDTLAKMADLSRILSALFKAARNMQGVHVSLMRPVSISLETIFQATWQHLRYIGFSRWNMTSEGIIDLMRRHKASLRSVRFREVRLTKGTWIEVAQFLRQELQLNWVSFRQVGYEPKIGGGPEPEPVAMGMGFTGMLRDDPYDDYEETSSESSIESDFGGHTGNSDVDSQAYGSQDDSGSESGGDEALAVNGSESLEHVEEPAQRIGELSSNRAGPSTSHNSAGSIAETDWDINYTESPNGSVAGDSETGIVNDLALDDGIMEQHTLAFSDPLPGCSCAEGYSWEDLEDDHGLDPTKPQWKWWERWVIRRCSIKGHDPRES